MQGQGPGPGQIHSTFGAHPHSAAAFGSLQGPGMGMDARYGLPSPADEMAQFRYPQPHSQVHQALPSISLSQHATSAPEDDIYFRNPTGASQPIPPTPHGEPVGPSWGAAPALPQHPHPPTPAQHHPHVMRPLQSFYAASSPNAAITLPPPHSLGSLSVSAPNPSPLSGSAFPSLGPSTGPGPSLGGQPDVSLGLPAPGVESSSPTPELAAHVSLGSNRLPPDSTLLTPLPGYEPDTDQGEAERNRDERDRERDAEYARMRGDRDRWDRGRERHPPIRRQRGRLHLAAIRGPPCRLTCGVPHQRSNSPANLHDFGYSTLRMRKSSARVPHEAIPPATLAQ
ncbi:hypothetical protein BV20DRAFT_821381 [Pilatotrama ljubarskyi]|nr:hypothetical protein BV20DRAFT_821381 [Pilatotrama ljubarskyi]